MQIGFEYPYDEDGGRRRADDDAPRQVPMRPSKGRRNLTTDEKKVKHRLQRRAGVEDDGFAPVQGHALPDWERDDAIERQHRYEHDLHERMRSSGIDPVTERHSAPEGLMAPHNRDHWEKQLQDLQERRGMSTYHNAQQLEAELLQAMAKATPDEQVRLANRLDETRAAFRRMAQDQRDVDLANTIIRDTLTPVVAHTRHTAATDWFGEDIAEEDPTEVHQEMLTEASLWFTRLHPEVRADREEFIAQAMGVARRVASQHGLLAPQAERAFLDRVAHLHGRMEASAGLSAQADVTDLASFELPTDVPDELAFEGGLTTEGADDDHTAPWTTKEKDGDAESTDGTGTTTDPSTQHDQSGYGVSGLSQDEPIADDQDPMWSEDWPQDTQGAINPPPSGAGRSAGLNTVAYEPPIGIPRDRIEEYMEEGRREDEQARRNREPHPPGSGHGWHGRGFGWIPDEDEDKTAAKTAHDTGLEDMLDDFVDNADAARQHPRPKTWTERFRDMLHEPEDRHHASVVAADTGNNRSDRDGSYGQVPEEIEKLDDPDNRPMWPWDMEDDSDQASDVAGTHTPGQGVADYPQPKKSSRLEAFKMAVSEGRVTA